MKLVIGEYGSRTYEVKAEARGMTSSVKAAFLRAFRGMAAQQGLRVVSHPADPNVVVLKNFAEYSDGVNGGEGAEGGTGLFRWNGTLYSFDCRPAEIRIDLRGVDGVLPTVRNEAGEVFAVTPEKPGARRHDAGYVLVPKGIYTTTTVVEGVLYLGVCSVHSKLSGIEQLQFYWNIDSSMRKGAPADPNYRSLLNSHLYHMVPDWLKEDMKAFVENGIDNLSVQSESAAV